VWPVSELLVQRGIPLATGGQGYLIAFYGHRSVLRLFISPPPSLLYLHLPSTGMVMSKTVKHHARLHDEVLLNSVGSLGSLSYFALLHPSWSWPDLATGTMGRKRSYPIWPG
jgi:hypothetical protein